MNNAFRKLQLLVVEDNPGDSVLIEDYLMEAMENPEIHQAKTFAEAKEQLGPGVHYHAILLDLSLPDAQGEQLVTEILLLAAQTPVIVLTGYANKSFGIKTLTWGVSDYLLKDELTPSYLDKSIAYSMERKRISLQLLESEEKYRNLFHLSPQPMWVFDMETYRFLNVNEAAVRHYGYSEEEFLAMTVKDIRPSEDVAYLERMVNPLHANHSFFQCEARHLKKDGTLIYVDIQTNNIDFDGKNARLVLAKDITEERHNREQIILYNKRLKTAQEIGKLGYWEFDLQTEELYWSDEVYHIFGVAREEFVLTYASFFQMIYPNDQEKVEKNRNACLGGESDHEIQHRIVCPDGTIKHVYQRGTLVYNGNNTPVKLEGVIQDVSERMNYIQAIEEQNQKLREIAWTQSHKVRTPLCRIMGLVNLLHNNGTGPMRTEEILTYIMSSAEELDKILREIVKKTELINNHVPK